MWEWQKESLLQTWSFFSAPWKTRTRGSPFATTDLREEDNHHDSHEGHPLQQARGETDGSAAKLLGTDGRVEPAPQRNAERHAHGRRHLQRKSDVRVVIHVQSAKSARHRRSARLDDGIGESFCRQFEFPAANRGSVVVPAARDRQLFAQFVDTKFGGGRCRGSRRSGSKDRTTTQRPTSAGHSDNVKLIKAEWNRVLLLLGKGLWVLLKPGTITETIFFVRVILTNLHSFFYLRRLTMLMLKYFFKCSKFFVSSILM